jgi:polysaccharide pyruvyl transferase WcaK-like protein
MRKHVRKIAILAHAGTYNLGDEAIVTAVIQNIRAHFLTTEICAFTTNPRDTHSRHGIAAHPLRRAKRGSHSTEETQTGFGWLEAIKTRIRRNPTLYALLKRVHDWLGALQEPFREANFLVRSFRNLRGTDLLLVAGSQQLNDYFGGPWGFPYTLWSWSVLARLRGTKVAFLSVGAGPLDSRLSRFFVKYSLSMARYRSYRDESSRKLVEEIGLRKGDPVVPDLVYSLQINRYAFLGRRRSRPLVAVNPVPYFDGRYWPEQDCTVYETYVAELARFVTRLSAAGRGVCFFPTQLRADPLVIDDIRSSLGKNGVCSGPRFSVGNPANSLNELVAGMARADFVVATRYHGVLLALLLNKPVLGIAYHSKTHDLMAEAGQSEFAFDIASLDGDNLMESFGRLEAHAQTIQSDLEEKVTQFRWILKDQYERVFQLCP